MDLDAHPYRSVLYMPGSRARVLEKARGLPADALILDLEDAVAPSEKARARSLVAEAVRTGGYGARRLLLRINGLDTEWGPADMAAACGAGPHAILVPKVESADGVERAVQAMEGCGAPAETRLWAMIETPRGVLTAAEIAMAHPRLEGFVVGTNDLVRDLGAAHTPERLPLVASLSMCLLAARAAGLICVDGVHNAFRDRSGLEAACVQGRDMGFDGKSLIHPDQLETANRVFAPSTADLARAEAEVTAHAAAVARGEGVAVLDGRIVENLHAAFARRLLARAAIIAALEGAGS